MKVLDSGTLYQIQFWGNLGGTVGSAILGAVLANRLPDYLKTRDADLHLPAQVLNSLPKGGSANSILDPTLLAKLPPSFANAIRWALSDTLHDIYLFAGLVLVVALVSTFFIEGGSADRYPFRDGPRRSASRGERRGAPAHRRNSLVSQSSKASSPNSLQER